MRFQAYIIEKIWNLISVHYLLQIKRAKLLKYLSYKYLFVDSNLDKVQTQSKINIILYSLYILI